MICRHDCSWVQAHPKDQKWSSTKPVLCPQGHAWRKGYFYVFDIQDDARAWSTKYTRAELDPRNFNRERFPCAIQASPRYRQKLNDFYQHRENRNTILQPLIVATDGLDKFGSSLWPLCGFSLNTPYPGEFLMFALCPWHPQRFNILMDLVKVCWAGQFAPVMFKDKEGEQFRSVLRVFLATADDPGTSMVLSALFYK